MCGPFSLAPVDSSPLRAGFFVAESRGMNEADSATEVIDDETGFDDGFAADAPTETPGQGGEGKNQAGEAADTTAANDGANAADTPPAPEYVQLTKAELEELRSRAALIEEVRATQEKSFGTAFGKLGDVERRLKALSEGAPVAEISQEDIDTLRNDGFEPLANALEKIRGVKAVAVGGSVDESKLEELVQQRMTPALQRMELRLLASQHPDWKQIDADPAFPAWVKSKGDEFAQKLATASNAYDSEAIGQAMTEFKAHRAAQAAATKRQEDAANARRSRFNAAVTPRGTGTAPPANPEDEFDAGFNG